MWIYFMYIREINRSISNVSMDFDMLWLETIVKFAGIIPF